MKKYLLIFILTLVFSTNSVFSQPPGGGNGGPPCVINGIPYPPSACTPIVPIDDAIYFLLMAGIVYGIKKSRRKQLTS